MILYKTLNKEEVLEALAVFAVDTLPEEYVGELELSYNEEEGVDIMFIPERSDIN